MSLSARLDPGCRGSALEALAPRQQFPRDKTGFSSKKSPMFRLGSLLLAVSLVSALQATTTVEMVPNRVVISVSDQKLMLLQNGAKVATYPISTSKFGLGDDRGRMTTPLGWLQVAKKIGDNAPSGAVFHNRRWTGEILRPNAPGRDPITTRIIWLRGLEARNAHAFTRCIYIHGTPEEKYIGRPASYGCIRMKARDVATLYNQLPLGAFVQIVTERLPKAPVFKASKTKAALIAPDDEAWMTSARSSRKPQPPLNKDAVVAQNRPHA
jgi:lipoprotein-anchoring transpeptidase ErfK/SrfK